MTYGICNDGELVGVAEGDTERVERWREDRLVMAGWNVGFARQIAIRPDIDLHAAIRLIELGCDQRTGWRILR